MGLKKNVGKASDLPAFNLKKEKKERYIIVDESKIHRHKPGTAKVHYFQKVTNHYRSYVLLSSY